MGLKHHQIKRMVLEDRCQGRLGDVSPGRFKFQHPNRLLADYGEVRTGEYPLQELEKCTLSLVGKLVWFNPAVSTPVGRKNYPRVN